MLRKYRQKIDKIDTKIAKYLYKRYKIVKEIAKIKQQQGLPVFNKKREKEHISNISSNCDPNSDCKTYVQGIFEDIFSHSRDIQK